MPGLGVRYGKRLRETTEKINKKAKKNYECPSCNRVKVRRTSSGVWQCKKCNTVYASNAYSFR
jgi:large subunit ribosomal protein L37Ae